MYIIMYILKIKKFPPLHKITELQSAKALHAYNDYKFEFKNVFEDPCDV